VRPTQPANLAHGQLTPVRVLANGCTCSRSGLCTRLTAFVNRLIQQERKQTGELCSTGVAHSGRVYLNRRPLLMFSADRAPNDTWQCYNTRSLKEFAPMEAIPTAVCLTSYAGGPDEFMNTPLEDLAKQVRLRCEPSLRTVLLCDPT